MPKSLLFLLSGFLGLLFLVSCGEKEAVAPNDPDSSNPIITQIKGDWLCTFVEESVYMNDTGEVLRVTEGESNDVYTFANTYYQKKSSPYRYFVYAASKGNGGKMYLHLEGYDAYTLEVTTLNTSSMVWEMTFHGNSSKSVRHFYFKR